MMGKYLTSLQAENICKSPSGALQELQEGASCTFCSGDIETLQKYRGSESVAPGAHRCYSVHFQGLGPIEVLFTPAATLAEVEAIYPMATVEPVPEPSRRPATAEQANELRELVALIVANGSEQDRAEALAVALADPDAALLSFRTLATQSPQRTHGSSTGAPYAMKPSSPL